MACGQRRRRSPTGEDVSVYAAMSEKEPKLGTPDYMQRKTAEILNTSRESFRLALEAGVQVAAGTDCRAPGLPHGTLPQELRLMVESGATSIRGTMRRFTDLLRRKGTPRTVDRGLDPILEARGAHTLASLYAVRMEKTSYA
jgi:hypothetical protein